MCGHWEQAESGLGEKPSQTATACPPRILTGAALWQKGLGCAAAGCIPARSASPGDTPLGLNALHPGVIYVLELQVVVYTGSVDTHRDRDGPQPIG